MIEKQICSIYPKQEQNQLLYVSGIGIFKPALIFALKA